ncbi:MAG TPA: hypothetical protein VHA78_04930 [Candidatus Peribacteraceae bacterium]|nr:hypothetical protein [Candidatus Peribacteraceae bacterium]
MNEDASQLHRSKSLIYEEDTQVIERTSVITAHEQRQRLCEQLAKIESFSRMERNKLFESMRTVTAAQWDEYEKSLDLCQDPRRKIFLRKLIQGVRRRVETARLLEIASSS